MLDQALDQLGGCGPDLRSGMTSHAPMVAEALCALGRPEAVIPWLERYGQAATPRPPRREPIDATRWRDALSREDRFSDWSAFFARELATAPWRAVLDAWISRLAPGICAAATHGLIRVGHAARALGAAETRARRSELADALALWASSYQELPSTRVPVTSGLRPREAIAHVRLQPRAERRFAGTIVSSLEGLADFPAFAGVIGLLDPGPDPAELVAEMKQVFARVLLDNTHDTLTAIVFTHGVTSVAAFGNLLPHIADETARAALPYAWQSACALYAAFGSRAVSSGAISPAASDDPAKLVDRAVAHGDEHAIKLAEACLARGSRPGSAALAAAVERVLQVVPPA